MRRRGNPLLLVAALAVVAGACSATAETSSVEQIAPTPIVSMTESELADYAFNLRESIHWTLQVGIAGEPGAPECAARLLVDRYGADAPIPAGVTEPKSEVWATFDDAALDHVVDAIRECKADFDERYSRLYSAVDLDTFTDEAVDCLAAAQLADDGALLHQLVVDSLRGNQDIPVELITAMTGCGIVPPLG